MDVVAGHIAIRGPAELNHIVPHEEHGCGHRTAVGGSQLHICRSEIGLNAQHGRAGDGRLGGRLRRSLDRGFDYDRRFCGRFGGLGRDRLLRGSGHGGLHGGLGRGIGLNLPAEGDALHGGVVNGSVGGHGVHGQRVCLVLVEEGGFEARAVELLSDGFALVDGVALRVADDVGVAAHAAVGAPLEGERVTGDAVDAVLADDIFTLGRDDQLANRADLTGFRIERDFHAHEADAGDGVLVVFGVHGMRGHGDGVGAVRIQAGQRNAGDGHLHVPAVGVDGVAVVHNGDVVADHIALSEPGDGHAAVGRVGVRNVIDAVFILAVRAQFNHGRADLLGLLVRGRAAAVQLRQGIGVGHAGGLEADPALEGLHGLRGRLVEVAAELAVVVAQLRQAALEILHAGVLIAAPQGDVAAVFRRIAGEELLLHGDGGAVGLRKADLRLEASHGFDGGGIVAAAHVALEVVERLQARVQLAHAVAAVAPTQLNVAGAGARGGGEQQAQRLGIGHAGHAKAIFLLEQLHGALGAGAEDAVRIVRQIAQIA